MRYESQHEYTVKETLRLSYFFLKRIPFFFQLKFLEVSHLSFVLGLGPKLREGNVKKRSGGQRAVSKRCCGCFQQLAQNATAHWDTRWENI